MRGNSSINSKRGNANRTLVLQLVEALSRPHEAFRIIDACELVTFMQDVCTGRREPALYLILRGTAVSVCNNPQVPVAPFQGDVFLALMLPHAHVAFRAHRR